MGKKNGRIPRLQSHCAVLLKVWWGLLRVPKTLRSNYFHHIKTLLAFFTLIFPQVYSVSQRLHKRLTSSRRIQLSSINFIRDLQNSENVLCLSSHKCFKGKFWKSFFFIKMLLLSFVNEYFEDLFKNEHVCANGEERRERKIFF